jgi:hypothetical protein
MTGPDRIPDNLSEIPNSSNLQDNRIRLTSPMPRKTAHPEDDLQMACVEWLGYMENMGKLRFFHVPNGGRRNKAEAARFKKLGVRAGVPDLVILSIDGRTLFIEFKSDKGYLSPDQKDWREWLSVRFDWAEIRGLDALQTIIKDWLNDSVTGGD